MRSKLTLGITASLALSVLASGCGEYVEAGRSPVRVIIASLEGASGAGGDASNTLQSDVVTVVDRTINGQSVPVETIFSDSGHVVMSLVLRDPGTGSVATAPSSLNQVTFTRYRVTYRRADGRNTPGVDVPYAFDSAVTFTVSAEGGEATFELVRHTAKQEAPLAALRAATLGFNATVISTIADVTFYGRDLAGNDVSVMGSIGIFFGNFGDPD